MNAIEILRANKKTVMDIRVTVDNKTFQIIGVGPQALWVKWYGQTPGTKHGALNQCWWRYDNIDSLGRQVIDKVIEQIPKEKSIQSVQSVLI